MVTVLPPPGTASKTSGSNSPSAADELRGALLRAKNSLSKVSAKREEITMALLLTAEIQASMFAWSFSSGYAAKKGKKLAIMGVDVRPVLAGLMAASAFLTNKGAPHLLAVANGTLGSFMAEWAFDLGIRAATPKEEREAAAAAAKQTAQTAQTSPGSHGLPNDVPPAIRLHVANEAGAAWVNPGQVAVETGSGLRLTAQQNINHWFKVYGREMAQYHHAKSAGHKKHAERSLANAQNAKASGMQVYMRAKAKGHPVVLPDPWKPKPATAPQPQQQYRPQPQQQYRPQPQQQYQQQAPQRIDVYDQPDPDWSDDSADPDAALYGLQSQDQADFYATVDSMSDDEMDAVSGAGGDNGAGDDETGSAEWPGLSDGPLDWPQDEFADMASLT